MPAREHARVVGRRVGAGGPGRQVLSVVELLGDYRSVDVAFDEGHEHFRTHARQVMCAPVRARNGCSHAQPDGLAVAGVTTGGDEAALSAARRLLLARTLGLPMETHLHTMVALGVDSRRCLVVIAADHERDHGLGGRGLGPPQRHDLRLGRLGLEAVAVAALLEFTGLEHLRRLCAEVVGRFVAHAQREESAAFVAVVLREREALARTELSHAARGAVALDARFEGHQLLLGAAGGGGAVGIALRAGAVVVLQHGHLAHGQRALHRAGGGLQHAGVPGVAHDGVGGDLAPAAPGGDGVGRFGGVDAVEADLRQGAVGRGCRAVEDHQAVVRGRGVSASTARRLLLLMLEAKAQALFRQQAQHEGQVRLAVLHAGGPHGHLLRDFEAEAGGRVVGEHFTDDVLHVLGGVHEAVAAQAERGEPGLQMQPVARQAAVTAQRIDGREVTVPGAKAAVGQQQAQAQLFADQRERVELARGGEGVDGEVEELVDAFAAGEALDDNGVLRRRRGQLQLDEPRLLREPCDVQAFELPWRRHEAA
ncbi:hypothetical protein D3C87_1125790 [compost metagenome]